MKKSDAMEMTISQAQTDMRFGYYSGAAGILASAFTWTVSAFIATFMSTQAGIWALLIGGVFIYPVSVVICKLLHVQGSHTKGNPLGSLAGASTFWLIFAIIVAFALSLSHPDWFFPAMLLTIGGRYLVFASIYGMPLYWGLGLVLAAAGIVLAALGVVPAVCAFIGVAIEIAFAVLCIVQHNRWVRTKNSSKSTPTDAA